jgi:hypothetical protein
LRDVPDRLLEAAQAGTGDAERVVALRGGAPPTPASAAGWLLRPAVPEPGREALALAEEAGEPRLLFPCYDGLATVHLDLDDEALAEEFMQKAQAVCERAGLEPDALVVLPFLV